MSATQSRSGASALKSRSTRSGAGRARASRIVVRVSLAPADAPQAGTAHQSGDPLAAHRRSLARRARHECGERRRCLARRDGSRGCDRAAPRRSRPVSTAPGLATRSTRWWRPPAAGTSWRRDTWPGWLSRTRRPGRDRAGLPSEPGRGFCQYLAFLAQPAVLAPEPSQLLALGTGQAVMRAALVTVGLADPVADRLGGWLELPSQLLRRAARANQLDHLLPEPGWIGGRVSDIVDSFPTTDQVSTKTGQVQYVCFGSLLSVLGTRYPRFEAILEERFGGTSRDRTGKSRAALSSRSRWNQKIGKEMRSAGFSATCGLHRLLRVEGGCRRDHQGPGLRAGASGDHRQRHRAHRLPLAADRLDVRGHAGGDRHAAGYPGSHPEGRLGEPEDLAGPLLFLASRASDFYTGHVLYADGGYTAG